MQRRNAKRKTRRQANKAPAQRPIGGFHQRAHVPDRFPPFPKQLQFNSKWNQTAEVALGGVGSTQYNRTIGLFDFLNNIPQYALDAWELYRYCRICAVDVNLHVVGEQTSASTNYSIEAAIGKVPFDEAASITPQELRTVSGGKYGLMSQAGLNRILISGSFGSFDELGNPVYDRTYWQTQTDAVVTTPADTSRPVIAVAVRSVLNNASQVAVNLSVTYHMQFFGLELPPLPALKSEITKERAILLGNRDALSRLDDDFAQLPPKHMDKVGDVRTTLDESRASRRSRLV